MVTVCPLWLYYSTSRWGATRMLTRRALGVAALLIQLVAAYLEYCAAHNINLRLTVYKGTLYELQCKEFMTQYLHCHQLVRVGGAYDNGVDIIGRWNLRQYKAKLPKLLVKPPLTSLLHYEKELDQVLVIAQCKNVGTKIGAKVVRELAGIYEYNLKRAPKTLRTNYMFLFSPHPLSDQGMKQWNTTDVPMVHVQLRVGSDALAHCTGIHMNRLAVKQLTGLGLEAEFAGLLDTRQPLTPPALSEASVEAAIAKLSLK